MSSVTLAGPVAILEASGSAVYFSRASADAGTFKPSTGTVAPVKKMQTALEVAFWGEDNRFPQNIEAQMAYCGIGKTALKRKSQELWGGGIIPGKIIDYKDGGSTEVFQPLNRQQYKPIYSFIEARSFYRFYLEFLQDWAWFGNCFPEMLLSQDAKTITGFVHQESCDSRYRQMNEDGEINTVYLSKLWGAASGQFSKFDPTKRIHGLFENPSKLLELDNKFLKALDCIDMYDPVNSLKEIGIQQVEKKDLDGFKSAILPVNYPSVNKTYYQVPSWDGARLAGWVEIASKTPELIKLMYKKAYTIKHHIQVPESYMGKRVGDEKWDSMSADEQRRERTKVLREMDEFLTSSENAYKSFVSFFDVDPITKAEYGLVKINSIEDKVNLDREMLTQSAADLQILIAMQVHPTMMGAGTIGTGQQRSGGSDIREASLIINAGLNLERQVLLEPLYLVRDYNRLVGSMSEWEEDIVFRIQDTILTTLDTGKGTQKIVS